MTEQRNFFQLINFHSVKRTTINNNGLFAILPSQLISESSLPLSSSSNSQETALVGGLTATASAFDAESDRLDQIIQYQGKSMSELVFVSVLIGRLEHERPLPIEQDVDLTSKGHPSSFGEMCTWVWRLVFNSQSQLLFLILALIEKGYYTSVRQKIRKILDKTCT